MRLKKMGVRAKLLGMAGLVLVFMAGLGLVAIPPVTAPGSIVVQ